MRRTHSLWIFYLIGYLIGRGEFQLVEGWDENVRDQWKRNDVAVHALPQRCTVVAELGGHT